MPETPLDPAALLGDAGDMAAEMSVERLRPRDELDYPTTMRVVSGAIDRPRDDAANDDELVGFLDPREREVLLMHEVYGVALPEIASAVRIPRPKRNGSLQAPATACAPQSRRRAERATLTIRRVNHSTTCCALLWAV
jgi:hypothetical protein